MYRAVDQDGALRAMLITRSPFTSHVPVGSQNLAGSRTIVFTVGSNRSRVARIGGGFRLVSARWSG